MHMLKKIMQGYDLVPNIKGIVASMVRVLCNVRMGCRRLMCISVTFFYLLFIQFNPASVLQCLQAIFPFLNFHCNFGEFFTCYYKFIDLILIVKGLLF